MTRCILIARVASEGYCCMNAYLRLCKARGETQADMADWIGVHRGTIVYNYKLLGEGRHPCMRRFECMHGQVSDIERDALKGLG